MNARQQPPVAPFRVRALAGEIAAQRETLRFERGQHNVDFALGKLQRSGQYSRRHRPQTFEPAADQLAQRFVALDRGTGYGRLDGWHELRGRAYAAQLAQPFRRHPEGMLAGPHRGCAAGSAQIVEQNAQIGPVARFAGFRNGHEAEDDQGVVEFVGVTRARPRLCAHARDRGRIEPPQPGGVGNARQGTRLHRQRPALLRRRIVEKRVRPGVQHFFRQW